MSADLQYPRRPNRAHGAVDEMPEDIRMLIKDAYIDGLTYAKICEKVGAHGYNVSKSQVHRWLSRKRNEIERMEVAKEKAATLAKYLVPEGTEVEQSAVALAQAIALEALVDAKPMQAKTIEDLAKIMHSVGRLQSSSIAREKWAHDRRKLVETAMAELKAEAQKILVGEPELERDILNLFDRAQEKMVEA